MEISVHLVQFICEVAGKTQHATKIFMVTGYTAEQAADRAWDCFDAARQVGSPIAGLSRLPEWPTAQDPGPAGYSTAFWKKEDAEGPSGYPCWGFWRVPGVVGPSPPRT